MSDPSAGTRRVGRVHLFSNGSEFSDWQSRNCEVCLLAGSCALETMLAFAYFGDGKGTADEAARLGRSSGSREPYCTERVPNAERQKYEAWRESLPTWTIRRGDGYTPVEDIHWTPEEAQQAIRNYNDHPSHDPKYQYTITRTSPPTDEAPDATR